MGFKVGGKSIILSKTLEEEPNWSLWLQETDWIKREREGMIWFDLLEKVVRQ